MSQERVLVFSPEVTEAIGAKHGVCLDGIQYLATFWCEQARRHIKVFPYRIDCTECGMVSFE